MFKFKSEILDTFIKYGVKADVNDVDTSKIDELVNKRTAKGWVFITCSFIVNSIDSHNSLLITFRKEKWFSA